MSGESFKAIFAKAAEATESDEILFVPFPDPRRKPFNMVNIQNPYPDFPRTVQLLRQRGRVRLER